VRFYFLFDFFLFVLLKTRFPSAAPRRAINNTDVFFSAANTADSFCASANDPQLNHKTSTAGDRVEPTTEASGSTGN
jgi:hypothetical protein